MLFPNSVRSSPLLPFRASSLFRHDSLPKFNPTSRKRQQLAKPKINTQRHQYIIQKDMEMVQRQSANDDSMCFCNICLKDVSSFDNTASRDYFSVLEHHAFSHYIDAEAVDFFHRGTEVNYSCHDEKNDEEGQNWAIKKDEKEELVTENSSTIADNNNMNGGQDLNEVGPRNAQLLSRAIVGALKDHHITSVPRVHLILVQDSVDHRSDTAMDGLKTRVLQHLKRDVVPQEPREIDAEIKIFACFFIGVHRARSLHEMVICPLHDEYYSCCMNKVSNNAANDEHDNSDNHQRKLDIDLRTCLLIPPRSTNSTERIVYCLIEMLSVLSQSLANHRNSGWLVKDNDDEIKNKKCRINTQNEKKRLSIGILCDHQHVWTNLVTLFGKSGDFDLLRI